LIGKSHGNLRRVSSFTVIAARLFEPETDAIDCALPDRACRIVRERTQRLTGEFGATEAYLYFGERLTLSRRGKNNGRNI